AACGVDGTSVSVGGAHAAEWAQADPSSGVTISPFGSCSISLRLTPADVGDRSATLSIADDANHTPQKIVLTGTGTDPKAVAPPPPLTFDPPVVNPITAEQTVTDSNPGRGPLHIT